VVSVVGVSVLKGHNGPTDDYMFVDFVGC